MRFVTKPYAKVTCVRHVILKQSVAATRPNCRSKLAQRLYITLLHLISTMVNCRISPDRKYCALDLWNRGWDTIDICNALSVSRASLYRWQAIFEEHGNVIRPKSPLIGRTRILVRATLTAIHTLYEQESDLYLDELVTFLAIEHSIIVSLSTLSRNLSEAGLTRKLLHKLASERDEILREEWKQSIRENFAGDGSEFVFVDETSKNEHVYARRYGRAMSGSRALLQDVFVRGDRYSLVAAITTGGYIATTVVPGSLDSFDFYAFIAEEVVSSLLFSSVTHLL